ncbi:MAG TPA: glucosaminidase domain-containing protein [Polyangiaceae bacterium]|nr:glucosaminidase domain-containing protein [Polyangiaceae bacterium]
MRIGVEPSSAGARASVREVQAQRTPASMGEIRAALGRALEAATGRRPNGRTLDVLAAQVSLETAHGSSMYNFNFGGIKGASQRGETANYMTREVLGGHEVHLQQGFRAYGSLDEGARDYVAVLNTRFPQAYAQAAAGNVDGFAHALKQSHYFTASEDQYAAGLRSAAGQSARDPSPAPIEPVPTGLVTSAELSRVLDAIASTAAQIADPTPKE